MNAIKNRYDSLTGTEKKVADYILKNHGKVSSMSVAEFSEDAGVTQASVVRCCKSLGFQGYADLKMALAVELSKNRQLNYTPYIYPTDDASTILDKIFSANVKTLHDTAEKIDRATLQNVVDLLDHAHAIYIYGIGTSAAIVTDFQYRIMQLGYTAFCYTDVPSMKISTMNIRKGDVAIGISHSGRTIATIEALQLAGENGAGTVCITSYPGSRITQVCDHNIEIFCDEIQYPMEAISARIAHISVIDAITTALSAGHYDSTLKRSQTAHQLINSIRY
jgi:DNA-binding MurR/RpiR family transcriptional regulator